MVTWVLGFYFPPLNANSAIKKISAVFPGCSKIYKTQEARTVTRSSASAIYQIPLERPPGGARIRAEDLFGMWSSTCDPEREKCTKICQLHRWNTTEKWVRDVVSCFPVAYPRGWRTTRGGLGPPGAPEDTTCWTRLHLSGPNRAPSSECSPPWPRRRSTDPCQLLCKTESETKNQQSRYTQTQGKNIHLILFLFRT